MKRFPLLTLFFCLFIGTTLSQPKTEFGITANGSWFLPEAFDKFYPPVKNGIGAGIGAYASKNVLHKLSADIGISFQIKQMKEYYSPSFYEIYSDYGSYSGYSPYGYGYSPYGDYSTLYSYDVTATSEGWKNLLLNYIVIPFDLRYTVYKDIFIKCGIEAGWLTNFETINNKTEFNWSAGFGFGKNKLRCTIDYIRGLKNVIFVDKLWALNDNIRSKTKYRNSAVQVTLSYPLWQKK